MLQVSIWNVRITIHMVEKILSVLLNPLEVLELWVHKNHFTTFGRSDDFIDVKNHSTYIEEHQVVNEQISHDQTFFQDTKTSIKEYITMEIGHSVDYQHVHTLFFVYLFVCFGSLSSVKRKYILVCSFCSGDKLWTHDWCVFGKKNAKVS